MANNQRGKTVKVLLRDRKKGSPIARQRVDLFWKDNKDDRNPRPDSVLYTDKEGAIYLSKPLDIGYWSFTLKARRGSDRVSFSEGVLPSKKSKDEVKAHIFLDRAIYRPGQFVFAKVLLNQHQGDQFQVLANQPVDIEFRDANGQVIEKRPLRTNAFGSAHTSFVAPDDRLLGKMSFRAMNKVVHFRVEEYKRPTFMV